MYYLKFLPTDASKVTYYKKPSIPVVEQWPPLGEWSETIQDILPFSRGYHVCRKQDFALWCDNPTLWIVEAENPIEVARCAVSDKVRLIRQIKEWNDSTRRKFIEDLVERVRRIQDSCPKSKSVDNTLDVVKEYSEDLSSCYAVKSLCLYIPSLPAVRTDAEQQALIPSKSETLWQINHLFENYLQLNQEDFV